MLYYCDFATWARHQLAPHKRPGYAAVNVSCTPIGRPPGDVSAAQMEVLADLADRYSFGELRVTHNQNVVLADVRRRDLYALWRGLGPAGLATPNHGLITDAICCPGLDYCSHVERGSFQRRFHARAKGRGTRV